MIKTTDSVTLQNDKEKIDPRGRTPLMLAVRLSNLACVKCLLAAKCNATYEHEGWSSKSTEVIQQRNPINSRPQLSRRPFAPAMWTS